MNLTPYNSAEFDIRKIPVRVLTFTPTVREQYRLYVAAQRKAARAAGQKVVGYMTIDQWFDTEYESEEAYEAWLESRDSDFVEFPHGEFAPQCNVGPLY